VDMKEIMVSSLDKLECVDKVCYLGDVIGAGGGAEELRMKSESTLYQPKFKELAPALISRGGSFNVNRKFSWAMNVESMARLEKKTERMMVRWMCGLHLVS